MHDGIADQVFQAMHDGIADQVFKASLLQGVLTAKKDNCFSTEDSAQMINWLPDYASSLA